jgi:hypothetical protein|tara:strand:+ start:1326 stop:1520 length:195 start_codon:yes stop_codon:yes gene_type:complete
MINTKNLIKYIILLTVVTISTYYIPNCSIMNEHAIFIGLLAATTFAILDRYIPHVVLVEKKELY